MSAVQVFLTDEAAVMLTDAVTYNGDNRITAIRHKAQALPHLSCVVAIRGPQDFADDFVPRLAKTFSSFEELIDNLALAAEIVWEASSADVRAYGGCEVYVVGWSHERERAEGWFTSNVPAYGEPWQTLQIGPYASAPPVEIDAMPDDIIAAGIAIAEQQRGWRDERGNGGVGGFLMMSAVTPLSIQQAIVHRWNDAVGDSLRDAA